MKTLKTIFSILWLLPILIGCATKFSIPESAENDARFVGKWEGQHFVEPSGYLRKWVQTRKGDGTFTTHLKYYDKNDSFLKDTIETGYWWIENDLFNEISPKHMSKPESYRYQFLEEDKIKFTSVNSDSPGKEGYSFVDTRVRED